MIEWLGSVVGIRKAVLVIEGVASVAPLVVGAGEAGCDGSCTLGLALQRLPDCQRQKGSSCMGSTVAKQTVV